MRAFTWLIRAGAGQHAAFREFATKLLIQGLLCGSAGALAAMVGVSALPLGFASSSLKRLEQSNCTLPLYNEVVDSVRVPQRGGMALWRLDDSGTVVPCAPCRPLVARTSSPPS